MTKLYNCIDAGSRYCPCNLATTLDCISCSQLKGEEFCDCNWNGICILYEYYMQNKKLGDIKNSYIGSVEDKVKLDKNLFLLKIKIDKELLKELNEIGAYVFIKNIDNKSYYETPMSIFNLDENNIYIVYQETGPKTKSINNQNKLAIKGPYWNGIIGPYNMSNIENSNLLIIARGIGQSSILLPIKKLIDKGNNITLILDKGKLNYLYSLDYIANMNIKIEILDIFSTEGDEKLKKFINDNNINAIFSAGAEMLHRKIHSLLIKTDKDINFFISNNNTLCCGEGICGSCIRKISNGEKIKTCKTIINPRYMY